MDTLRCPRCWKQLPGHSMFCSRCGARLPAAPVCSPRARTKGRAPWLLFLLIGFMVMASHRTNRKPQVWSPAPTSTDWSSPPPRVEEPDEHRWRRPRQHWSGPAFRFDVTSNPARFNDARWRLENKQGVGCETDALPRE